MRLRTNLRTVASSALLMASLAAGLLTTAPATLAAPATGGLVYRPGYSVQGGWLCYGWPNGRYHCTQHWHSSGGHLVSDNPSWVPNVARGGSSSPASAPKPAPQPAQRPAVRAVSAVNFCTGLVDFSNAAQWAVPHGCYGQIFAPNPANYPSRPSWGWCNWISEESHLTFAGYAALYQPKHFGAPRVGAVVWFNGGDQGASADGHWANLIAIGPNGWGLIEEMNFYFRGGGFAKADYRFIHLYQPGTAYLY